MIDPDLDDEEYEPDPHPTQRVEIKSGEWADVDVEMVPLVNWLNSYPSVKTHYCCQGDDDCDDGVGRPYVMFTCSNLSELERVLRLLLPFGAGELSELGGEIRYTIRFHYKFRLQSALQAVSDLRHDIEQAVLAAPFRCAKPNVAPSS